MESASPIIIIMKIMKIKIILEELLKALPNKLIRPPCRRYLQSACLNSKNKVRGESRRSFWHFGLCDCQQESDIN